MIKIHIAFPYFILHNLSGYDADFIKNIKDAYKERTELPIIKEKYISFTKYIDTKKKTCIKLRIIDSFKFLTNLEKLVSYFDKDKLKIRHQNFLTSVQRISISISRVKLYFTVRLRRKVKDTSLPPRESFYHSLTGDTVSKKNYAHAVNVWQ